MVYYWDYLGLILVPLLGILGLAWAIYLIVKSVSEAQVDMFWLKLLMSASLYIIIASAFVSFGWLGFLIVQLMLVYLVVYVASTIVLALASLPVIVLLGILILLFQAMKPRMIVHEIRISVEGVSDSIPSFYRVGRSKYPEVLLSVTYLGDGLNYKMILRHAREAASVAGIQYKVISDYTREATLGDYNHLIQTTIKWFEVEVN